MGANRWPLKRPITNKEWLQILKAMIVRRVPQRLPIPRDMLAAFVSDDVKASLGRLKVEKGAHFYTDPEYVRVKIGELVGDGRLEFKMMGEDEKGHAIMGTYRTDRTQEITDYLPIALKKVLDYLPVTNLIAWLAFEAADAEEEDSAFPPVGA